MKLKKVCLLTVVCSLIGSGTGQAVQRMGLLSGGSARIPAGGSGRLPTVCLDEHAGPPTTSSRYVNVLNTSSPDAVTVEIDGRSVPLQRAIEQRLVSISGVTAPTAFEAEISAVRVNNLSGRPIHVRVKEPAVLGTEGHRPFDYEVTGLLGSDADQDAVWREQRERTARPRPRIGRQNGRATSPANWLEADRVARETVRERSTKEMSLFHFSAKNGEFELTLGDGTAVPLSAGEREQLKSGQPLHSSHALSLKLSADGSISHVLYCDPKLESNPAYIRERNALAFGLQAAYPKANIYRDPLSDQTSSRAEKLSEFSVAGARDLMVVIPEGSGRDTQVQLTRTISNIGEDLARANVEVKRFKAGMVYDGKQGRAVFVITGHSSEQLAAFVRQVGEAGFFRDNYVILNSCGVGPAPALINEINSKHGAIGTFSFRGEIKAAAVQDYMLDLLEKLKGTEARRFVPLLIESARSRGLFGMFTISWLLNGVDLSFKTG